jgi:hypothetical protein
MPLAADLKSHLLAVPLQLHPEPALFDAIDAVIRKRA